MKKTLVVSIIAIGFLSATVAMADMNYQCWTYINGKPDKMIKRLASNNSEATSIATTWFRDNGYKYDYIKCH